MFDHTELKGKLRGKGYTTESFAKAFGISTTAMSNKLNGYTKWTDSDISKAIHLLDIQDSGEIRSLFLCPMN